MLTKTILTGNVITSGIFSVVSKTRLKCLQYKYPSLYIKTGRFSSCIGFSAQSKQDFGLHLCLIIGSENTSQDYVTQLL